MQQRKVTYRLYPNKGQEQKLADMLGVHQRLYNKALEQRIHLYQEEKLSLSFYDQCKYLTLWRADDSELAAINCQSEQVTLKRLDLAFKGFFRRLKNGETPGFPRFKPYNRFSGWGYKAHGDGWSLLPGEGMKNGHVNLSGVGKVGMRGKARTLGLPKTAEVLHKSGRWYLSVTVNCEKIERKSGQKAVGIDWGVESFATIADNHGHIEIIENPRLGRKASPKIKKTHKAISKSKKGSKNRRKKINKLAKEYSKLHNKRQNFLHQEASKLVTQATLISTEDLNIKQMVSHGGQRKKGLNREILDTAPSTFFNLVKYKAEEAGIYWVDVPTRQVKPSQTCHKCLVQVKKALSERWHDCSCGASCSRDANSARVMLNWALLGTQSGQELSEVWSGCSLTTLKQETPSIILL